MSVNLEGLTVVVAGGDQREQILISALAQTGARVIAVGYTHVPEGLGIRTSRSLLDTVPGAHAVIAPMSSTDAAGNIKAVPDPTVSLSLDREFFNQMRRGAPLLIGIAHPIIRSLSQEFGIRVIELAEVDEIATLNSIPTAEGALQRAMEELPVTIHGTRTAVLGFGRCAVTLVRMLQALGADTHVIARNPAQLARAYEMGAHALPWDRLATVLPQCRLIFNTVPARVLDRPILERLDRDSVIIDIASAPGGIDFDAARALGIKAFLELGLPGRVAPKTAGEILARCVPPLLYDLCT